MNENQNNSNTVVNETPQVIAIPDIQIEKEEIINNDNLESKPRENEVPINTTPPESPKGNTTSTVLLILLFVFLFVYIMGMPYIRTFIQDLKSDTGLSEIEQEAQKEEQRQEEEAESNKPTPTPEEEITKEITCTSTPTTVENYTLVQVQQFYYNSNNQVLNSKQIYKYNFAMLDDTYTNLKTKCDEDSLKYLTHEGYTMSCSYDDVNIELGHEFDLEKFKPIIDGTTNITANATYKQNLDEVKSVLINQGYTCIES